MLKKVGYIILMLAVTIPLIAVPTERVQAKTLGDIKKELAQFKQDYADNKFQKELSEEEKKKLQSDIVKTNQNIEQIGKDIVKLNEDIENLNKNIEEKNREIKSIMNFVQISNGDPAYLEYAFGAQTFTDFIYRVAVSEQLSEYNDRLISEYNNSIKENKQKTKELADKKVELARQQDILKEQLKNVQSVLQELEEERLSIKEEIEARETSIKVLQDRGCKDNEDMNTCGLDVLPYDTSFWRPIVKGEITDWYGSRPCVDPRVTCFHVGTDMSTSGANTGQVPIYPVANGVVMYITGPVMGSNGRYQTLCGGRKLYIQHNINGQVYTSGYLHLRQINVKIGQVVSKDEVIGIMGGNPATEYWDTCTTGAHLHLEISLGTFGNNDYYDRRVSSANYVNFPKSMYSYWYDRTKKFQ